jgi:hypothetical protein
MPPGKIPRCKHQGSFDQEWKHTQANKKMKHAEMQQESHDWDHHKWRDKECNK